MLKLLFLLNNLENGGAERVLVNLVNELSKNPEYDIAVRCLNKSGPQLERLADCVRCEGVFSKTHPIRGMNYLYLLPHKLIYNKIKGREDYDVIIPYLHGVLTRIISYAPAKQKTIAYLHANMEKSPFIRQLGSPQKIQKVFKTYNKIIAVSEDVKTSFQKVSGMSADKVQVLYNTFDVEEIKRQSKEPLDFEMDKGVFNICSVGKLEEVKGYLRLVSCMEGLKKDGLRFHLYIVGEGPQRRQLEQEIEKNGLQNEITLVGFQKNPYKYISKSDLFVCSSYSEGFSSVVAESMILGVPVTTTDCSGMAEMLGADNKYGIIVPNNEEALYDGIKSILQNKALYQHYQTVTSQRSQFFEPKTTVKAFEDMLQSVLNQ